MGRRLLLVAPMLFAVLVVSGVALVLSACGRGDSAQQKAKAKEGANARHLPPFEAPLRPGEYRSEKFKPSYSFTVGKGWANNAQELPDFIELERQGEPGYLRFANIKEVYEPGTQNVVEAPKDLVGWFQNHPYLKTDKPEPITVGGVKGQQFDMIAEVPEDHVSMCGTDCVDAITYTGSEVVFFEGDKIHAIVLEDVKGETIYLDYGGLASDFDKVAPEGQKLVDSVKWTGS